MHRIELKNRTNGLSVSLAICVGAAVVQVPFTAHAAGAEFYVHTFEANSRVFALDADTGAKTLVGQTGVGFLTDIAFAPDGSLFATTLSGFYSVNPINAATTLIGPLGTSQMVGLDFSSDQNLYGVGQQGGQFFRIDLGSGAATALFTTPFTYNGDVAHYQQSTFYATATFAGGSHLIEINAAVGSAVDRGLIFSGQDTPGLDFDANGRLIAFSTSGHAYLIPSFGSSGAGTLLSDFGLLVGGATAVPIPEPSTSNMLVVGGLAIMGMCWNRRAKVGRTDRTLVVPKDA